MSSDASSQPSNPSTDSSIPSHLGPYDPYGHFDKTYPGFLSSLLDDLRGDVDSLLGTNTAQDCTTIYDKKSNMTVWATSDTKKLKDFRLVGLISSNPQVGAYGNLFGPDALKTVVRVITFYYS